MMPYLTGAFGNPSSASHRYGWEAEAAIEQAQSELAELIGVNPNDLIFTSGATESNNLAITGFMRRQRERRHLLVMQSEHRSVLDVAHQWEQAGGSVTSVPPRSDGLLDLAQLDRAATDQTAMISVMAANNEIGVIQPIEEVSKWARSRQIVFHCDAVQAFGKVHVPLHLPDLVSLSAHKIYGPKGVGLLVIKSKINRAIEPLLVGGGQQNGLRAGTLNVAGIVGLAKAAMLCFDTLESEAKRLSELRDRLWQGINARCSPVALNGHPSLRLPGNLNVSIEGIDSNAFMAQAHGLAISAGSACSSGNSKPSHVILSLGYGPQRAKIALRVGLGRTTTASDIDTALHWVGRLVPGRRQSSHTP